MTHFEIVAYALLGLVAGTINGLLGIGCGVVVVPLLITFGWPLGATIATSHVGVLLSSLAASYLNRSSLAANKGKILSISFPAIITAQLSSHASTALPPNVVLLGFSALMFVNLDILTAAHSKRDKLRDAPELSIPLEKNFFSYLMIGSFTGSVASVFGLGGGLVVIPLMLLLTDETPKNAVKTSLGVMTLTSTASLLPHLAGGTINYSVGTLLGFGTIVGALIGSSLLPYVPDWAIRKLITISIVVAGIHMYFFGMTR